MGNSQTLPRPFPRLAIGLIHYPNYDRMKKVVATNITHFDIHDIARASQVYGVEKYYLIHPMREQQMYVERILDHWKTGYGSQFNPFRKTALSHVRTADNIESAIRDWGVEGVKTVATHARPLPGAKSITFKDLRHDLHEQNQPIFLLFGTGFGMTEDFMKACSGVLEPIKGASPLDYRHLSVRSAVSICLDRLMGTW